MNDFIKESEKVNEIIRKGGIILYPTDTIWGIGCDATNPDAIKRIYQLKKREEKKSLIIMVDDIKMIENYVNDPSKKLLAFLQDQQYPTTCIFKNAIHLPTTLINEDGTIAIRIVKDLFCKSIISRLKKPLVSTSANISGAPFPKNFAEISDQIKSGVDYIVMHRQQDLSESEPSAIITLNDSGEIIKLR